MAVKKIENKDLMDCDGKNVEFLQCNNPIPMSDFYDSWSPFNVTNFKRLNKKTNKQELICKTRYCKSCLNKIYSHYKDIYKDSEKALFYTCQMANVPFIAEKVEKTFDYVSSEAKRGARVTNIFGSYYNFLARETSKHHLWQDFSYTDIDYKDIASHIEKRDIQKKDVEAFELDWGKQPSLDDYEYLEYLFWDFTEGISLTKPQEALYRHLCLAMLAKRRIEQYNPIGEKGKDQGWDSAMDKVQGQIIKLMDKLNIANFEAKQEKSNFDLLFERQIWEIENKKPCEIVDLDEYKDICNIHKDWGKEILRSVINLVAGTKDYPDIEKFR